MIPALLAAFLFAVSAVVSRRTTRLFGAVPANFFRLGIACAVLGLITVVTDAVRGESSLHAALFPRFFWSGVAGFGVGDVALFLAYARLGSRLTILLNWCSAALVAAAGDFLWRDRGLSGEQWGAVAAIMSGLAVALYPSGGGRAAKHPVAGVCCALLAGVGMGSGTVLSGVAIDAAAALGLAVPGVSQAFQRSVAGVAVAGISFMVWRRTSPPEIRASPAGPGRQGWLLATALCGPVAGVSCYQWAQAATGSSAVVVAIAATSTLLVIPLAWLMEHDRPRGRELAGTLLAAAGVIALKWTG